MAREALWVLASRVRPANTNDVPGGRAYGFSHGFSSCGISAEDALAQYVATGTFRQTFYADATARRGQVFEVFEAFEALDVLELVDMVDPSFLAKLAIYSREKGFSHDVTALLAAYLAAKDVRLLATIFPRVIDNGTMLRNFVRIVRSGVVGRKSLGSAPKRLARAWFANRSPDIVFRQSLGSDPSMADIIKLVRPPPKTGEGAVDGVREALYGYLIGKDVAQEQLPASVRALEAFKRGEGELPDMSDVPFEMLATLDLDTRQWTAMARQMSWTQLWMNLGTLLRRGVFHDTAMVSFVTAKLRDPELVRQAQVFPFQLLASFHRAKNEMPAELTLALREAMEIAIEGVPSIQAAIYLCVDISDSMQRPAMGSRTNTATSLRCIDVAALLAAALLRKSVSTEVIPFADDVMRMPRRLHRLDSVMRSAEILARLTRPSSHGAGASSTPLRHLNARRANGDMVIYVMNHGSWAGYARRASPAYRAGFGMVMSEEWELFRVRNPNAKLVLIDIRPNIAPYRHERADVLNVGGFSDSVFDLLALFAKGELAAERWTAEIESVSTT